MMNRWASRNPEAYERGERPFGIDDPDPRTHECRVQGRRAVCWCGYKGEKRDTQFEARLDARRHREGSDG